MTFLLPNSIALASSLIEVLKWLILLTWNLCISRELQFVFTSLPDIIVQY